MGLHPAVERALIELGVDFEVMDCDPALADTAEFCRAYGVDPADSANAILVSSRKPPGIRAMCMALATTRLDVNHAVRQRLGVRKLSFASAEETLRITGMEIGGVTPFGLPPELGVLIDEAVMTRTRVVIGGGNRVSKVLLSPTQLLRIPGAEVGSFATPHPA
ncbi:MAG: hypothetical protein KatS3mg011_2309 [Acidimicrobiia bacterium]|nr:MAG: hypothetical protein KatS3mg011_2309 [Acidimicrobiia bacterium]